jgi:class 3 adenylate cyclase/tetratricopeptide (TPR) repeat protein/GTPase SAR1 family protein
VIVCAACGTKNPAEAKFCMTCASPLRAEEPEAGTSRRTVTVVFTDVVESTPLGEQLDPEALRRVMSEFFDRMRGIVERHGGTVEKFIGDAVMAVFGIPTLHEDDALRAVRATVEMRDELARLNVELEAERGVTIAMRTGVNTGEVVAGDPSRGQTLAVGDAINTAARLEQAAGPGEILLGGATQRLVREAIRAESVEPLVLKGKAEPVAAFRLDTVEPGAEAVPRRLDSPMVGRDRERQLLQLAFDGAVADRSCHLATILGPAGVGKSRLMEEFLASLPDEVQVRRGRCLPYGEGITYWPVVEVVHQAAGITADDLPTAAEAKLSTVVGESHDADLIRQRVAQVIGLAADSAVPEETFWGIRRFLESFAGERPLVVVFDDIHWGEPTFLDLVEHLADFIRDAAVLVCCLSRNELLDARPGWGGGKVNATTVLLEPLSQDQCDELIENLLGRAELNPEARDRIVDAAEGNPLFVEEMLSMLIDDGLLRRDDGRWVAEGDLGTITVPPSIQALLAARLDRLEREERAVVERASVVGRVFYRSAVSELSPVPAREALGGHLRTLVRRELIRPYVGEFDDETYRFRHLLIRDSAYEAMPKEVRADLHERFGSWLEERAGERLREYEEIIGYHLEQANRYRTELGPADVATVEMARRAGVFLGRAGVRATRRGDVGGAVNLLSRAVDLLPADDPQRIRVLPDLAEMLLQSAELERAGQVLQEVTSRASEVDASVEIRARVVWAFHRVSQDPAFTFASALQEVEGLVARAQEIGDDAALVQTQEAAGAFLFWLGRSGDAMRLLESAIERARTRGMPQGDLTRLYGALSGTLIWGPVPVDEGIARMEQVLSESSGLAEAYCRGALAQLRAMRGEIDEARTQRNRAYEILEALGNRLMLAADQITPLVEMLAGDPAAAEAKLREGIQVLREVGETGFLSTSAAMLAQTLVALRRNEEAEQFSRLSEENAARDDMASQVQWRTARAVAVARQGRIQQGEALARDAVSLARRMDYLTTIGDALVALAEVLVEAGNTAEAAEAAKESVSLYVRKGDRVSAGRARRLMEEIGE